MRQSRKKSIKQLLTMSSAEVSAYLVTLSAAEWKRVSTELHKAILHRDVQKNREAKKHASP